MTLEFLMQEILKLTAEQRQEQFQIFDYSKDEFVPLPQLCICTEGKPDFHLTINQSPKQDEGLVHAVYNAIVRSMVIVPPFRIGDQDV